MCQKPKGTTEEEGEAAGLKVLDVAALVDFREERAACGGGGRLYSQVLGFEGLRG